MERRVIIWVVCVAVLGLLTACAPEEPRTPDLQAVEEGSYDPGPWREVYPQQYADWEATKEMRPSDSKYKRDGEEGTDYDKLSEYPYMAAMTQGIGFAVEYNEPRGHWYMMIDQLAIDPARLRAGGVCLTCKSAYGHTLYEELGDEYFGIPYFDAVEQIPEEHRELGVTCLNCHDNETMDTRVRSFQAVTAFEELGVTDPDAQQRRTMVCAQCHVTYVIPKEDGVSVGLDLPWTYGEYGDIGVEHIIQYIKENEPQSLEWTQTLTGFRLGYIRHPEYELFSRGGIHWRNGVTCPDCHMPYKIENGVKTRNHTIGSPFDDPKLSACRGCHPQDPEEIRQMVFDIQDRVIGEILMSGFSVTTDAKLFQMLHEARDAGAVIDQERYDLAKEYYEEAFYRAAYLGAENSIGFHNPPEASRIAADSLAYSQRAEGLLRQMLTEAGVQVPAEVPLELREALSNRGERGLQFMSELEFRDPRGVVDRLWAESLADLRGSGNGEQ